MIRVAAAAVILLVSSAAASTGDDTSPGPYCLGSELGMTRWSIGWELALNYCTYSAPGDTQAQIASCATDGGHQLAYGDESTLVCGYLDDGQYTIDVYWWCVEISATTGDLPIDCWRLTGWDPYL